LTVTDLSPRILPTKIPVLDDYLLGGLRVGSLAAFWSEVEVDVSSLALQALYNRGKEGDKIIFVCTTKKPKQILQAMSELGFENDSIDLHFIDAYSSITKEKPGLTQEKVTVLASSNDSRELGRAVEYLLKQQLREKSNAKKHSTLLVFDSFSAYIDRFDSRTAVVEELRNIRKFVREEESTGIFVFTQWDYEQSLIEEIRAEFDFIIELKSTSDNPVYSMSVFRQGMDSRSSRLAYFKVLKPGGVKIHIPKIVVTGPFHAGKTSFIHSASKGAVSADRLGTTVALDFAHVSHKGFMIDIFGTPGQTRFDPLLQKLGGQAIGVIVFVSATDRIGLNRVRSQMRIVKSENLPYVVAVNKVNLRGALSLPAVRNLMGIPARIPMIPLKAKNLGDVRPNMPCELDPQDVSNVLDQVVLQITKFESSKKS
jgi:small GTP-binding protein